MIYVGAAAAVIVGLLNLALGRYLAKGFERADTTEWSSGWRGLDRARRKRISVAVRRGEMVRDPEDAKFAVALATESAELHALVASRTALALNVAAATVAVAAYLISGGLFAAVLAVIELIGLAVWLSILVLKRVYYQRYERARTANAQLLGR